MIMYDKRNFIGTVTCDFCQTEEEIEGEDFYDFIANIKQQGWIITKDTLGDWTHYCEPKCRELLQGG